MSDTVYDALVIGEGITGLTAANHLARHGHRVATFEAQLFGGLVINVNELEGHPPDAVRSGADLAAEIMQMNAEIGVASIQEEVTELAPGGGAQRIATGAGGYRAAHVVIASGARLKKLAVPGEQEFEGRGVSQCADCDGAMFKGEEVVVVGGGDSALQEALVLAKFCRRVHLVHRGTRFRARAHFVEQVSANANISAVWNTVVQAVLGSSTVEKVQVKNLLDGQTRDIACAGFFAYVGLAPSTGFAGGAIARDENGAIVTNDALETAVAGVWAAGAARSGYSGRLADAVAEAERVARAVHGRLASR
ncbi:MAG: FAD-dependent oxidoreductase [Betaproteobacteria bacterium]|nr:FAD-dependent oxidoreductase [Betaproteobacteria bacterium]